MRESCYCGRTGDPRNQKPVFDGEGRWALRCPDCGHLDYLEWLPEEAGFLFLGEAKQRRKREHVQLSGGSRAE